ncbi:hypothetical protein [Halocynthiibacter sp.]|uniref:hypothetical protein n=1 Tax=Halocynthiibacter sp. TaxID=1979210 RepID=UPI003C5E0CDE
MEDQLCVVRRSRREGVAMFRSRGLGLVLVLFALLVIVASGANATERSGKDIVIVHDDRGGLVQRRVQEISEIRLRGQDVQIGGGNCLSSCTMFLGLESACVFPETSFGFHGPSQSGDLLSDADFNYWSHMIAAHYPEPIRTWYLREGRQRTHGFYRISGAELIRLGLPSCMA